MMGFQRFKEERKMTLNDPRNLYSHATNASTGPLMHVRFAGSSRDIALDILEVAGGCADDEIKRAVASFLDVDVKDLAPMVIERHENGNMTMRPPAVFG